MTLFCRPIYQHPDIFNLIHECTAIGATSDGSCTISDTSDNLTVIARFENLAHADAFVSVISWFTDTPNITGDCTPE